MDERARDRTALLTDRLRLVGALAALGAEALKLQQREGALRIEMMRVEDDAAATDGDVRGLEAEADALAAARGDLDDRVAAAERDIGTIDRLLASAGGGRGEDER